MRSNAILKDFSALANVDIKTVPAAEQHRTPPRKSMKKPQAAKPVKKGLRSAEAVEKAISLMDVMLTSYGIPGAAGLASGIARSVAGVSCAPQEVFSTSMQALAKMGVLAESNWTRTMRLMTSLERIPAVVDGSLVRIRKGELEATENGREAAPFTSVYELPEEALKRLGTAKLTKPGSLKDEGLRAIKAQVPDFGALIALAAIEMGGYKDGRIVVRLDRAPGYVLEFLESVVADFRETVTQSGVMERGNALGAFLKDANRYFEVVNALEPIRLLNTDGPDVRRKKGDLYRSDKERFDALKEELSQAQAELDEIQEEATTVVDSLLALVREARSSRAAYDASRPSRQAKEGRIEAGVKSRQSPEEAVAEVRAQGGVEADISVPHANVANLGFNRVERKSKLKAVGLDGGRVCTGYPGVVWEAIAGPFDHALDFERTDSEIQAVLIAARRPGGLGVDMSTARYILVNDFEDFFAVVD